MKPSASEIAALKTYSGPDHRRINACLRRTAPCSDEILVMAAAIDRVIAASTLRRERILFRGIGVDAASVIRSSGLSIGSTLSDAAFMSTSADPRAAGMFASLPTGGLILRIRAPTGTNAFDMSAYSLYPEEAEFLLPRNTVLRVLGYRKASAEIKCEVVFNG